MIRQRLYAKTLQITSQFSAPPKRIFKTIKYIRTHLCKYLKFPYSRLNKHNLKINLCAYNIMMLPISITIDRL